MGETLEPSWHLRYYEYSFMFYLTFAVMVVAFFALVFCFKLSCATPVYGSRSNLDSQERLVRPPSSSPSTGCLQIASSNTRLIQNGDGSRSSLGSSINEEDCETRSCISSNPTEISQGRLLRFDDLPSRIDSIAMIKNPPEMTGHVQTEKFGMSLVQKQLQQQFDGQQRQEEEDFKVSNLSPAPNLSTPDLLYHHHHVSYHSTLPHKHCHQQISHASAAATLNRYPKQQSELGGSHFRFNTHGDFMLENTQLGGIPYEPVLGSTSILTPNSIDQIIGPSAAATLKNESPHCPVGSQSDGELNCLCCGGRCLVPTSIVSKITACGGIYKFMGDFGLRENIYLGSFFICMTLIVIVCFIVINQRVGWPGSMAGATAALYNLDKVCEALLDPDHGEVHQTGRYLGDRAIYTCIPGWEIFGAEERVCQASGKWSNQEPYCKKKVYCIDPPSVQHATHNGAPEVNIFHLETVLKYACYPGYLTVGFAHAKCFLYNDTAQWFGPDITCKAIRCLEPEEIANGDVDRKCQTFGCRISYTCRPGYELVGRQHRYCQADGSWSPRALPDCTPIHCPAPNNPENGRAVFSTFSYNSLISYECNYGYTIVGDQVRRCERNKEWTGSEPHCKEINCGSPGILPNGWLEGSKTTLHAVVTFRCQEGMTFEGPSYRTICQADGRWSHPLPRCFAPCVVPHISHGFVADRASGSSVPHTHTIDVGCLSQFQKTHNSTPVCKNGTWSRIPKCIPAKCTELPEAPQNGMVVAPKLDHGMVGKFECRDGYMLKGHNTTQCFFGNWTGMTPWCKEVFCPFPGFIENGKVLLVGSVGLYEYRPYVRKIRNNRQIMFQCNRGFVPIGGPTGATCIDGSWSPPQLPRCQEEAHAKPRFARSTQKVLFPFDSQKTKEKAQRQDLLNFIGNPLEITTEFDEYYYEENHDTNVKSIE